MDSKTIKILSRIETRVKQKYGIYDLRREWRGERKYIKARMEFSACAHLKGVKQEDIGKWLDHADHSTVSRYIKAYKENQGKLRPEYSPSKNPVKKKKTGLYNSLMQFLKRFI